MPYSYYYRRKLRCRISDDSGRYLECVRRGRPSYNSVFIASTCSSFLPVLPLRLFLTYRLLVTRLLKN